MRAKSNPTGGEPSDPGVGYPGANLGNPKTTVRDDQIRDDGPGAGQDVLLGTGYTQTTSHYEGGVSVNTADKGSIGSVPDPSILNRGYTEMPDGVLASPEAPVSSNRLKGIPEPAVVLTGGAGSADQVNSPVVPKFGTGTTAD